MITMKIFSALKSGFSRTLRSWKGVLIVWFSMFILVLVFIYPLRSSLNSAFGKSMITEKLADGFDIEVFADLGPALKSLFSFFTAGFMLVWFIGFVMNAFLTAGLFGSVRKESGRFSFQEFLSAGLKNFWSFLIITVIITFITDFLSILIVGIPVAWRAFRKPSQKTLFCRHRCNNSFPSVYPCPIWLQIIPGHGKHRMKMNPASGQ
jgi:hypothetical protein